MRYKVVLVAPPVICPEGLPERVRETGVELSVNLKAENEDELPSEINLEEVANKVYRLMRNDLVLERERGTKLGG